MFFLPCTFVACVNVYQDWKSEIYYESEWGFLFSTVSILFSILAHYSKWFHSAALYTSEIAMGFNIIITIIFWGILVPQIVQMIIHPPSPPPVNPGPPADSPIPWAYTSQWMLFELAFVHSAPIINSIIELLATRMVFLRRDAKWAFLAGFIYMFCNYWGAKFITHTAIYNIPFLNWKKGEEWKSWLGYGAQGPVLAIIVYLIAVITQKRRGFKNDHRINKNSSVIEFPDKQEYKLNESKDANTSKNQMV
jgi:hypothetical protein